MFKKILIMLMDVLTFGLGVYQIVYALLAPNIDEYEYEQIVNQGAIGAFLIILGLLIHNWRNTIFRKDNPTSNEKNYINKTPINLIIIGLIIFSFLAINRKVSLQKSDYNSSVVPFFPPSQPVPPVFNPPVFK